MPSSNNRIQVACHLKNDIFGTQYRRFISHLYSDLNIIYQKNNPQYYSIDTETELFLIETAFDVFDRI